MGYKWSGYGETTRKESVPQDYDESASVIINQWCWVMERKFSFREELDSYSWNICAEYKLLV